MNYQTGIGNIFIIKISLICREANTGYIKPHVSEIRLNIYNLIAHIREELAFQYIEKSVTVA
jgi:hypothetical protein